MLIFFFSRNSFKYVSFVVSGESTKFGLLEKMKDKWRKDAQNGSSSDYQSTYKRSFNEHSKDAMVFKHFATRKPLSSHFHSHRVNKDLPLRNTHVNIAPEFPPLIQPLSECQ